MNNPMHLHVLGANQQESSVTENGLGILRDRADHEPAVCPWGKEDRKPCWLHQADHYKRSREVILSVLSVGEAHLGAVSSAGLSGKTETWTYWGESPEEPLRWWRACSLNSGAGAFCIQEEQAWGRNLSVCINISWEGKDVGARFLFVVFSDRTKGDGQKLK